MLRDAQASVHNFMVKAHQDTPLKPTELTALTAELRFRLIYEELLELVDALGYTAIDQHFTHGALPAPSDVQFVWRKVQDHVRTADAIADLLVVVIGTAVACGYDISPVFEEVMRSNMTKFIDGYKREDGKWIKGPSYSPADLQAVLARQMD